jgi:hypothetical protein
MRNGQTLGVALAGLALAGCAGTPAAPLKQDIEFVRGCWVEKDKGDGRINAFLRLLPDGPEGAVYTGHLQYVRGIRPGPEIRIAIARDGTHASATIGGVSGDFPADPAVSPVMDDGSRRIMFSGIANGRPGAITAAGKEERLLLDVTSGMSHLTFDGERDGCD